MQGFSYLRKADGLFQALHPDPSLRCDGFADKYGLTPFTLGSRPFWIGCGYGYYEKMPALYI